MYPGTVTHYTVLPGGWYPGIVTHCATPAEPGVRPGVGSHPLASARGGPECPPPGASWEFLGPLGSPFELEVSDFSQTYS